MRKKRNLTFGEHARTVLYIKQYKVRENTFQLHWQHIFDYYLEPHFGNLPLDEICRNDIEMYFIKHSDLAKSTLEAHLSVLNEIFNNAYDNDLIKKNPCEHFKLEVGQKSEKKNVYTPEQAEMILEYAKTHRFGLEIDILLNCGISRSELLGITWSDIDFDKKCIYIHRSVTPRQGKQNKNTSRVVISDTKNEYRTRIIAVPDKTIEHIKRQPRKIVVGRNKRKGIDGIVVTPEFLIYNKFGSVCAPDNWYERHYKVFMRDMRNHYSERGIDIPILTPHELRHTRASIWVNEGRNPFAIATQMGWADLDMLTKVYAHRDIEKLRKQLAI